MSAGSLAMPNANQETRETLGARVGQSANPFFLYPQSSTALSGAKRSAPMPTSSPVAPAPTGESQYNPATQQAMTKAKIGEFTAAVTSHLYTGLTPEQKRDFMPQRPAPTTIDRGGAGDTTYTPTGGEAKLRLVTKDGKVHEDNSDNTEGMTRGNFSRQFENALKAGKGDEFAARYMPQGTEGGYQARYDKFGEGSGQGSSPMPMDPDPRVRAAQVTAQARTQVAKTAADARTQSTATSSDARAAATKDNNSAKLTMAQWANNNKLDLAKMTEAQKSAAQKEVERHNQESERIGGMNADTNAQNAGTRATQAAQKGQVTPEDKYKAISDVYKNARMTAADKEAAVKALEEQWEKAAPATQGANSPAPGREGAGQQVGSLQNDTRWEKQDDGTYTHPGLPGSVYKDNGKSLVRVK